MPQFCPNIDNLKINPVYLARGRGSDRSLVSLLVQKSIVSAGYKQIMKLFDPSMKYIRKIDRCELDDFLTAQNMAYLVKTKDELIVFDLGLSCPTFKLHYQFYLLPSALCLLPFLDR